VTCAEFVELVTAYLEGQLDAETAQRFVDHMALCAGCDRYVEQFRRTISTLGTLPPESLSDEARDTLLAAFRDWRAA
jgi:anti-sigma factor RsiW